MSTSQAVGNPFGITVFGSSIVKTEPDFVSVDFAVSHTEQHPKDSFAAVRDISQRINTYLRKVDFRHESSSSRISLEKSWKYSGGEETFLGYIARVDFRVLIYDLNELENFLIGIVDVGVNQIKFVQFQTSRLKELRAIARRQAVEGAREKAENYCTAASVKPGKVLHIEDVNPDDLSLRHVRYEMGIAPVDENVQAFTPGNITINAAVLVSFSFAES